MMGVMLLIKKERKIPLILQKYEALLRRLPAAHPKRELIEKELAKRRAGYEGEKSIDYYLNEISKDRYFIFHDLRLPIGDSFVQVDTVLLSASYLLILEVKNIKGTLYFDPYIQLLRVIDSEEEAFPDPILQTERQQKKLISWLTSYQLPMLPIEFLIVISDPSTILKTAPPHKRIPPMVIRAAHLPHKIEAFEKMYREEKITRKEMNKISRLFLKQHTPLNSDVLSAFHLSKDDILTGVHCPNCYTLPILKHPHRNRWTCPKCHTIHPDAHIAALRDYALLLGTTITNRECRRFLHLTSVPSAAKLLAAINLEYTGTFRDRKYVLPLIE
jgi:ribosomal protein S27AE